jgi:hypothetical protein
VDGHVLDRVADEVVLILFAVVWRRNRMKVLVADKSGM